LCSEKHFPTFRGRIQPVNPLPLNTAVSKDEIHLSRLEKQQKTSPVGGLEEPLLELLDEYGNASDVVGSTPITVR